MKSQTYKVKSEVFRYPGMAGWHFIAIPKKLSASIKDEFAAKKRGWGSLRVSVTLGKSKWKTSIFPDAKAGVYLLPLKAEVRKKEGLGAKDQVVFSLQLL